MPLNKILALTLALGLADGRSVSAKQHDHKGMADMTGEAGASQSMAGEHLHMGNHMKMTAERPATPEDLKRAAAIVTTLRGTLEKYKDYRVALKDGYRVFLPDIPQPQYHFTNYWRGFEAGFRFDPAQPTSLLYKKTKEGYELLGAMYTAPRGMSEAQLDARVPLGVAKWHAHVNICLPPLDRTRSADWTRFGFAGSISTAGDCKQAGGRFQPQIFGWMVHVYPFESTPDRIWRH
jgi:hypothetical protein